ncbi:Cytochrome P450 (Eurofung) [Rasamsonia emersonii CBS 393.64]|uniref:Cytochrome P450 (Eurofung) n=1 Tax=Rasamsonia emersonii (strain ATCC 16479 / CBS 393.64 / IMI 116815) TaxID=1408163 RepID=A0A0F4Z1R6_RASE3|nr:Cytochrome P450 (Eurofung) [Rasamsonia emersonii CBS 393.64]KKA24449.1 Cytochrome P450 (Eurofung) [Rasamsonia emersonii CBS 393.64]
MPRVKGKQIPDVFATRDENVHRMMKKPNSAIYSMSNLVSFEPYVNSTMEYYFSRLDELFVDKDRPFDFGLWLHLFAFDVMGEITFSRRLGFLEKGGDVGGVMENNWKYFVQAAPATQMPWLDFLWKRNPLLPASVKPNPLVEFGVARIQERLQMTEQEREKINSRDFLSRFIEAKEKDPQLGPDTLPTWTNSNIQAGSDTIAIFLGVVFYHLLKNPSTLQRLLSEIDSAAKEGLISKTVTWKESRNLVYLDACIKEAARIHPPISFPLERIVPEPGLTLDGGRYYLPGGTRVLMNPWSVHRDEQMFDKDPDVWRPERWLCDEQQKKAMYNGLLTFGAGHRSCLGKNISYLEIYKLIPTLLQRYEIELADPNAEWHVETMWFTMPTKFYAKLRRRKQQS